MMLTINTVVTSQQNLSAELNPYNTTQSDTGSMQIAFATFNKDTLYVVYEMVQTMNEIWDLPQNVDDKPVIIPVKTLMPYFRKEE